MESGKPQPFYTSQNHGLRSVEKTPWPGTDYTVLKRSCMQAKRQPAAVQYGKYIVVLYNIIGSIYASFNSAYTKITCLFS